MEMNQDNNNNNNNNDDDTTMIENHHVVVKKQQKGDMKLMFDEACQNILNHNFDTVNKICFITLMKMIDNILQQPQSNRKVRIINTSNINFQSKIGSCHGGINYLMTCGFQYQQNNHNTNNNNNTWNTDGDVSLSQQQSTIVQTTTATLLGTTTGVGGSSSCSKSSSSSILELTPEKENQTVLIMARHCLMEHAINELHCTKKELPVYKIPIPPPKPIQLVTTNNTTSTTTNQQQQQQQQDHFTFNPYQGQRYVSSSEVANIQPPIGYISPTEIELQKLNAKKQQLIMEQEEKNKRKNEHQQEQQSLTPYWIAYRPNQNPNPVISVAQNQQQQQQQYDENQQQLQSQSDRSMLVQHAQKKIMERQKIENGTFTTKAMRDLQTLKKMKVYTHVVLTIQFPDGCKCITTSTNYHIVPKTTIQQIKESIIMYCLKKGKEKENDITTITTIPDFDLYITPPKRVLVLHRTLEEEHLVPASKLYISWKQPLVLPQSQQSQQPGYYLRDELFQHCNNNIPLPTDGTTSSSSNNSSTNVVAYPTGFSLDSSDSNNKKNDDDDDKTKSVVASSKPPKKKVMSREESLLQRMMGKNNKKK